jgi:hypothetical protein
MEREPLLAELGAGLGCQLPDPPSQLTAGDSAACGIEGPFSAAQRLVRAV